MLTILLAFCILLWARETLAVDAEEYTPDGKVDVVYGSTVSKPYREHRGSSAIMFGASVDQVNFSKFRSKIDNAGYKDLFGSAPMNLTQVFLGWKKNFALGGVSADLIYGYGSVNDSRSGENSTLTIQKSGLQASYIMDTLFPEPAVAPYISGQAFTLGWKEEAISAAKVTRSKDGNTAATTAVQAGLLFSLNYIEAWIDPSSAEQTRMNSGIENAYLDAFVSQYNSSEGPTDPNFQTDMNYGLGLRLEF